MSKARFGRYRGKDSWRSKKYIVTLPNNDEYLVYGLRNFCMDLNIEKEVVSYKCLHATTRSKYRQHRGFRCRYFDEDKDKGIKLWRLNGDRG